MERSEHKSLHEFIPGSGILPLAFLAIKRAAAGLNDFHDRRGAGVTFFLAPAVHLDPVDESALTALAVAVIAHRGAAPAR